MTSYSGVRFFTAIVWIVILISFMSLHSAEAQQCVWDNVDRIVAVGDVHGDYDRLVLVLRAASLIDADNNWIGGKTHLVQTGDIPDRGPDSKKAMDLLMKLETQAPKTGGAVHALIGNHEALIMAGDYRFAHPDEIESHGGQEKFAAAFLKTGKYGQWIARHNAVIKINRILFLHGGLSEKYASTGLEEINRTVREELGTADKSKVPMTTGDDGPLWYRGYAVEDESSFEDSLNRVVAALDIQAMVVGHTVAKGGITFRSNRRIVMIDVGLSKVYGGPAEYLVIEKGQFSVGHAE